MTDLDSLSSSLLYAYLRSSNPPRSAFTSTYIPLLNISASDIIIRPEFTALFSHMNISASHLITLDDLPPPEKLEERLKPANTRWILVDHNRLQGTLGSVYSNRVQGVVDHHTEENSVPQDTSPEPRVVEKCGSSTSLVIRALRSSWDAISDSPLSSGASHAQEKFLSEDLAVARTWDVQLAKMALASILIDTTNLTAEEKVETPDQQAVKFLEAKIQLSPTTAKIWNRNEFYNEINEAKQDIGDLEMNDILRKDFKKWTEKGITLGISCVVKPLTFLISKAKTEEQNPDPFSNAVEAFMSKNEISVFAIMTTSTSSGAFKRELLLQVSPSNSSLMSKFLEQATTSLGLEDLVLNGISPSASSDTTGAIRKVWLQKELGKSRKQVAPLLREAMR